MKPTAVIGAILGLAASAATTADAFWFGHQDFDHFNPSSCDKGHHVHWDLQGVPYQIDAPRDVADPTYGVGEDAHPCPKPGQPGRDQCLKNWYKHYYPSYSKVWFHRPRGEHYAKGAAAFWGPVGMYLFGHNGKKHSQWDKNSGPLAPMRAWDDAGVEKHNQDSLVFTVLNKPAKGDVKFIAFIVNGQEGCEGYPQTTVGTNDGWKYRIEAYVGAQSNKGKSTTDWTTGPATIDNRGAAALFVNGFKNPQSYGEDLRVFDLDHTLVVAVPENGFHYPGTMTTIIGGAAAKALGKCNPGNNQRLNNEMLRGWKTWVGENVNWSNIQGFFGYGMSRGGCFVTRFADFLFAGTKELQENKYTIGNTVHTGAKLILETVDPVCNPAEWNDGVSSYWKETPDAIRSPFAWIWSDYTFQPIWEVTGRPYHPKEKNDGDNTSPFGLPRNRCNGIHVNKLFNGVDKKNIRWLNSVAGADVLEWGSANFGKEIWAFCDVDTATASYIDVNRYSGVPLNQKAWVSEYQNLMKDFGGNTILDGKLSSSEIFPSSTKTKAQMMTDDRSNHPMPDRCDVWYKQSWKPFTHGWMGSAFGQENTMSWSTNHAPCWGASSCGYGTKDSWQPIAGEYLNVFEWQVPLTTCVPNKRADVDYVYKHLKHASDAAAEWFPLGEPTRQSVKVDLKTGTFTTVVEPNERYRPVTSCGARQFGTQAPKDGDTKNSLPWNAKFEKQALQCSEPVGEEEDGFCVPVVADTPLTAEQLKEICGAACEGFEPAPIKLDSACQAFAAGAKLSDLMIDQPEIYKATPNTFDALAAACSPGAGAPASEPNPINAFLEEEYFKASLAQRMQNQLGPDAEWDFSNVIATPHPEPDNFIDAAAYFDALGAPSNSSSD